MSAPKTRPCGCPKCARMAENLEKLRLDWERLVWHAPTNSACEVSFAKAVADKLEELRIEEAIADKLEELRIGR